MPNKAWKLKEGAWQIGDLIAFLAERVEEGVLHLEDRVDISSDEEGNRISPLHSIEQDRKRIVLFPSH